MRPIERGSSFVLRNIYFELDKSELFMQSTQELKALYEVLQTNAELQATIIGHTDDQGTAGYNQRLSLERAEAVVSYLRDLGIDSSRLQAEGKGMREPISSNDTEAGRAKNRRTEVLLR